LIRLHRSDRRDGSGTAKHEHDDRRDQPDHTAVAA
jgi:hypothetical protein